MSPLPPAETLIAERYQLKRRLAQGGMAEVWLAVDLTLDRKVAVKWLKPTLASDEVVAERFRREAIAAASLNHPNIVAVHDVFEHEGRQAVVMQLVDGKSLRQLLDTQKRLSPELTGHIGACTAAALHHAHINNFVHRDVKPGNIMITPDGRVLLTDFGIAKALAGGDDLTSENIMMGTAKYLSPEQVRGKKLDGRADLYSLGLVLYECLAGRVPFLGETDADTALARLQRDPTDLARFRPTLPTGLVTLIHQLLARNPAHRPATGAELVAALEEAANEEPPVIDDTPHEPSPIVPYSVGKIRRAPSDVEARPAERTDERRRPSGRNSPPSGTRRNDASGRSRRSGQQPAVEPARQPEPRRPMPGPRRIPGEPERITGAVPVQSARQTPETPPPPRTRPRRPDQRDRPTPDDAAQDHTPPSRSRPDRVAPDHTPRAGAAQRGRPAKGMSQATKPSLTVLGGLLLLAAIVAVALWMSVQFGADDDTTIPSTILPPGATEPGGDADLAPGAPDDADVAPGALDDGQATGDTTQQVPDSVAPSAGAILSVEAYDPDGDNDENDDEAVLALADGNPSTNWRTVCYGGEFMGGKRGVGLVVTLDGFAQRALTVDVLNGPYIVDFFTSANDNVPATLDGWDNQLGARQFAAEGETIASDVPTTPTRHLLVLLKQIGRDTGCTENNPYRGGLGEIALI